MSKCTVSTVVQSHFDKSNERWHREVIHALANKVTHMESWVHQSKCELSDTASRQQQPAGQFCCCSSRKRRRC